MAQKIKDSDPWAAAVIVITFVLFFIALFHKGFTHDILLEAGVLLVSIKLIMMSHKNSLMEQELHKKLDELWRLIEKKI